MYILRFSVRTHFAFLVNAMSSIDKIETGEKETTTYYVYKYIAFGGLGF